MKCKIEAARQYCDKKCERTMTCGHNCKGLCGKECQPSECTEPSQRKFSSPCGHLISLPCNIANLPAALCGKECQPSECTEPSQRKFSSPCGHLISLPCNIANLPAVPSCWVKVIGDHDAWCIVVSAELKPELLVGACKEPCGAELACKHVCAGTCVGCLQQRLHEDCHRVCPHGACGNRCGEWCSRAACDEACPRLLKCGHACRGLCGEPCPPVCKTCSPDTFPGFNYVVDFKWGDWM
ncbi:hypothetical protein OBRU01_14932 [Operophtera brumata]|uniref:NFX1-type zinc finger-containing protein 1 n=1 Tax=Operophtera brumata TaxID=104452 RepID=A0A0L7L5D8_OPEBR|nr:hypothetical protein OBRU01_14932 [Operophtera brumata]